MIVTSLKTSSRYLRALLQLQGQAPTNSPFERELATKTAFHEAGSAVWEERGLEAAKKKPIGELRGSVRANDKADQQ